MVVDVYQQKTKKTVTPAITSEHIENYINNEFPYKISIQKFNDYLKDLCKECEINEPTKGKIYDKESKRKKLDTYLFVKGHGLQKLKIRRYTKLVSNLVDCSLVLNSFSLKKPKNMFL